MIDKQLFDRFLKNECSAEERRFIIEYLQAHPDEAAYLLPEEEFEEVRPEVWAPERSDRSFRLIQQRLQHRTLSIVRWSLAAAALLVMLFGVKWLLTGSAKTPQLARKDAVSGGKEEWIKEINSDTSSRTLLLPDGSSAELSPGSWVAYHRTFTSDDQRLVKMGGEGQFKVVTNSRHPFIVVSETLTTTVLGTWFSVLADSTATTIKVHLYSGKVKVSTTDSTLYLAPGDELTYDKLRMLAVVRSPHQLFAHAKTPSYTTSKDHQLLPSQKPEWYAFGGQPLTEVFDQLSDYYGVQINYFPSDVENRYFTGKFSKTDSLEDILSDIALLHGLNLTKTEGVYMFRKKAH